MKKIFALLAMVFGCASAFGQASFSVPNAGTTGTTSNSLATIGTAYTAVIATTSNTAVPTYIVAAGAGTSGVAVLAFGGQALCTFDATNSSGAGGWYVIASVTTGGDCHAQSAAPSYGVWVVGFLDSASTSSGSTAAVNVVSGFYGPEGVSTPLSTANGGTGVSSTFTGIRQANGASADTSATGHQVQVPLYCPDTSGSGTAQSCSTGGTTYTPAAGDYIIYTTTTTNSGTGLTVNVNSLGAKSIAIPGSGGYTTTLTASIIPANKPQLLMYDGTNWDDQQTGTSASGGTPAYPLTITGGVSGGVAYGSSATQLTISPAGTANVLMKWGGAATAPGNSSVTDNGTTVTSTDTGGFVAPVFVANGTTAGFMDFPQGTTSSAVAPCNTATSICFQAPTAVTSQLRTLAGTPATGFSLWTNTSGSMVETITGTQGTLSSGVGLLGTLAINSVLASTVAAYAGHFTNLQVVTTLGGTCTTAPVFNVFDGTTNTGSTVTASATTQTKGTGTSTAQTQTFAAGDVIGIYVSTAGGTCTSDQFIVSAQYSTP